MIHANHGMLAVLLTFSTVSTALASWTPSRIFAAPARSIKCAATTLRLRPGLNPSPPTTALRVGPSIPRQPVSVSLPRYSGATALASFVATPFPQYPDDPYLQTASAEYRSTDSPARAEAWFRETLPVCGWHSDGRWTGNATAFTSGVFWVSNTDAALNVDVSFGNDGPGGTYIGYGVEAVVLPTRPVRSFLHGPFVSVHVALQLDIPRNGHSAPNIIHTTLLDRSAINHLVTAIDGIKRYRAIGLVCSGGLIRTGPAWLSFVRPNGSMVHAYEVGPGDCGGLAVNGVRWLIDGGAVWNLVLALASGRG